MAPQIKTRQRVRDLAEVYTHEREVNAMLDLVLDMFPGQNDPANTDRKFFEPACGSGNFLEAILQRKIAFVTTERYRSQQQYEHRLLRALASIYAIDIDPSNVDESKDRMRSVLQSHLDNDMNTKVPTAAFASAVDAILETNIVLGNTLTDLDSLKWVDYRAGRNGTFTREWSTAGSDGVDQLDLFSETRADEVPVHYSELADNPDPVTQATIRKRATA
jgi:type III restriction system methylase